VKLETLGLVVGGRVRGACVAQRVTEPVLNVAIYQLERFTTNSYNIGHRKFVRDRLLTGGVPPL